MTDERITAYLLQELSAREAEQLEEQCFAQPEWPAGDLASAENDLIEAYVRKELSWTRRRRFKKRYLVTQARKDRLLLARSFLQIVCPPKLTWTQRHNNLWPTQALISKYATVAAVLILSVALLWSYRSSAPGTFEDLNLTIASDNRTRGASNAPTEKITLPLGADALRVSLTLPEPAPEGATYSVQWENVKGPLKTWEIKSEDGKSIQVVIPADDLTPGQFALKLWRKNQDGTTQRVNGSYFFDVELKN